jgi:hypothetical protein
VKNKSNRKTDESNIKKALLPPHCEKYTLSFSLNYPIFP